MKIVLIIALSNASREIVEFLGVKQGKQPRLIAILKKAKKNVMGQKIVLLVPMILITISFVFYTGKIIWSLLLCNSLILKELTMDLILKTINIKFYKIKTFLNCEFLVIVPRLV